MSENLEDLKFDKEHEWLRVEGDVATVGISDYAQEQLGEVVYLDLPSVGDSVIAGETFGEIESVKSVSELIAPVSGEIIEVNGSLADSPETVNSDAHGAGWMVKVRMSDDSEVDALLSVEDYNAFITEG